jgi:hypothetical protein
LVERFTASQDAKLALGMAQSPPVEVKNVIEDLLTLAVTTAVGEGEGQAKPVTKWSLDGDGRIADFQALPHTFITNLANSGVHPSVARHLARHSDVNLALSRYTHGTLEGQSDAVESLPDISPQTEILSATRTDGIGVLGFCLAKQGRFRQTEEDESGDRYGRANEPSGPAVRRMLGGRARRLRLRPPPGEP